jgi:hypothetical protein
MSPSLDAPVVVDPNEGLTWRNLREHLVRKYSLPENAHLLVAGQTAEEKATRETVNVLGAFVGFPQPETLAESMTLLRVTSFRDPYERRNEPGGSWWFPETLLLDLLAEFRGELRSNPPNLEGLRKKLQSLLALSDNFSDVEQLWCIRLPAGTKLTGLAGPASPQPVDSSLAGSYLSMGNLPGRAWQYYFPNMPPVRPKKYSLPLLEGIWLRNKRLP